MIQKTLPQRISVKSVMMKVSLIKSAVATVAVLSMIGCASKVAVVEQAPPKILQVPTLNAGDTPEKFRANIYAGVREFFGEPEKVSNGRLSINEKGKAFNNNDLVHSYAAVSRDLRARLAQLCEAGGGSFSIYAPFVAQIEFATKSLLPANATPAQTSDYFRNSTGDFRASCRMKNSTALYEAGFGRFTHGRGVFFDMTTQRELIASQMASEAAERKRTEEAEARARKQKELAAARYARLKKGFASKKRGSQDMCMSEFTAYSFGPNTELRCQTIDEPITLADIKEFGWIATDVQSREVRSPSQYIIEMGLQHQVRIRKEN